MDRKELVQAIVDKIKSDNDLVLSQFVLEPSFPGEDMEEAAKQLISDAVDSDSWREYGIDCLIGNKQRIWPVFPGTSIIEDILSPEDMTVEELSEKVNIQPDKIYSIIYGRQKITNDIAESLAGVFEDKEYWLNLQVKFDKEIEPDSIQYCFDCYPLDSQLRAYVDVKNSKIVSVEICGE